MFSSSIFAEISNLNPLSKLEETAKMIKEQKKEEKKQRNGSSAEIR